MIATQEALRTVPNSLRQAALALGATRWQVVRDHVLPVGAAGHPDRDDPRPVAGDRRDGPAPDGRRRRLDPPAARGARATATPRCRSRSTITPRSPNAEFQTVAAGGILILLVLLLSMNAVAIVIRNRYRPLPVEAELCHEPSPNPTDVS